MQIPLTWKQEAEMSSKATPECFWGQGDSEGEAVKKKTNHQPEDPALTTIMSMALEKTQSILNKL